MSTKDGFFQQRDIEGVVLESLQNVASDEEAREIVKRFAVTWFRNEYHNKGLEFDNVDVRFSVTGGLDPFTGEYIFCRHKIAFYIQGIHYQTVVNRRGPLSPFVPEWDELEDIKELSIIDDFDIKLARKGKFVDAFLSKEEPFYNFDARLLAEIQKDRHAKLCFHFYKKPYVESPTERLLRRSLDVFRNINQEQVPEYALTPSDILDVIY